MAVINWNSTQTGYDPYGYISTTNTVSIEYGFSGK